MNRKTENYIKKVKQVTKEISKLRKKSNQLQEAIAKSEKSRYFLIDEDMSKEEYAKIYWSESDTYKYSLQDQTNRYEEKELKTEIVRREISLAVTKIAALDRTSNLSKSAKKEGFTDNYDYGRFLIKEVTKYYQETLEAGLIKRIRLEDIPGFKAEYYYQDEEEHILNETPYIESDEEIWTLINNISIDLDKKQANKIARR